MKILILTQYYPPEIGAPQNRLHELAIRLQDNGIKVDVLTAKPNYPKMEIFEKYKTNSTKKENIDGIRVYRSGIFVSRNPGIIFRLLNYFSFAWTSYWRGRKLGSYDYIMVESPPLFLGYTGMMLARKLGAKLIFNVSDLWPESVEKMGVIRNRFILNIAYSLEARCYRRSSIITGQTMGIIKNIGIRFHGANLHWLPNGVDLEFYNPEDTPTSDFRQRNGFAEEDLLFYYGGILGHAQGLQTVLHAAQKIQDFKTIKIIFQGFGPERDELLKVKTKIGLQNVFFLPPVEKNKMPAILKEVDVALVPLRKLNIFKGAIPSKIYEAMAMEKALLLGVDGEAKEHFIERAHSGKYFEPENVSSLVEQLKWFANNKVEIKQMGIRGRKYVNQYFNRNNIAFNFIKVLNSC